MARIVDMDYELGYSSLSIFYLILKHKIQIHMSYVRCVQDVEKTEVEVMNGIRLSIIQCTKFP